MIALAVPTDSMHEQARGFMDSLTAVGSRVVTSDLVIVEFLNSCSSVHGRELAAQIARGLLSHESALVVESNRTRLIAAMTLYESRPDKEWSIVDCSSMLTCRELGIKRVFTHDRHFRQAGFEILL